VNYVDGSVKSGLNVEIKVFLEGFYEGDTGKMRKAMDYDPETGQLFEKFDGEVVDLITIELHEPGNYGDPVIEFKDVELLRDGTAAFNVPAGFAGDYHITVKHRNHLETVSQQKSFTSYEVEYDFTTNDNKAFGDNQASLGLHNGKEVFGIYAGDIDDNGLINILDLNPVIDSIRSNEQGYIIEDINGDGLLNILDTNLIINNIRNNINSVTPE